MVKCSGARAFALNGSSGQAHRSRTNDEGWQQGPIRLTPHLAFFDDETPLSYAVRLAAFHTDGPVRGFLTDYGISFPKLKSGDPEATLRLANIVGVDPARLQANAITPDGEEWGLRGERFRVHSLIRRYGHVCAECLLDDLQQRQHPDLARLRERLAWRFAVVTACPVHQVALTDAMIDRRVGIHDVLMPLLVDRWSEIETAAAGASPRIPTPLQRYLLNRLEGRKGSAWLDSQPLDQAMWVCENLGAVLLVGPRPGKRGIDNDTLDRARTIGFDVAAGGVADIREALARIQGRDDAQRGIVGPQAVFGALFDWADQPRNRSKPFTKLLQDHIIETMPIGEGDLLFGEPVRQRRIHSLRSLSHATGIDPTRLRSVLRAAGVISTEQARREFNRCIFDAAEGAAVAGSLAASLTREQLAEELHITPTRAINLAKSGLIRTWLEQSAEQQRYIFGFLPEDVEVFMAALFADAELVAVPSAEFLSIDEIANLTYQSVAAVFTAVFDGRLRSKQRILNAPGITGLRINRNAALAAFQCLPQGAYRLLAEAAAWLAITPTAFATLRELPQERALLRVENIAFRGNRRLRAISHAALEEFDRQYVTPAKLARELEFSSWSLTQKIKTLHIIPAFDPEGLGAHFYCRRDLEAAVATLSLKPRKARRGRSTPSRSTT